MKKQMIELRVNGQLYSADIEQSETLLHTLRDRLNLTGTKEGCGTGDCGACTVVVDGQALNACLLLAIRMQGKDILTIEGLAEDGSLHPLQQAFIERGGLQCGYCTPGMLLSAKALIDRNGNPTDAEIRTAIAGNLCRCTGYTKIVESIRAGAETIRAQKEVP